MMSRAAGVDPWKFSRASLSVNMGGQRVEIKGAQQEGGGQFFDCIHKDKHHRRRQAPSHKWLIYIQYHISRRHAPMCWRPVEYWLRSQPNPPPQPQHQSQKSVHNRR